MSNQIDFYNYEQNADSDTYLCPITGDPCRRIRNGQCDCKHCCINRDFVNDVNNFYDTREVKYER